MKDDVKFYVRILEKNDDKSIKLSHNKKTIFVKALKRCARAGSRPRDVYWQFNTDGVFFSSNQNEIFFKLIQNNLSSVWKGADLVVIAFGQINSGKSYTISAPYESHVNRGIIPRLLATILNVKQNYVNYEVDIKFKMSFVEFFHDNCYDLLTSGPDKIIYSAICPVTVDSVEEALGKFFKGETRRKFEGVSNHCGASVLTLYIDAKPSNSRSANINFSKIHIVDCPGTESSYSKGKCQACKIAASLNKFNFDRAVKWSYALDEVLKSRSRLPCPPVFNCSNLISFLGRSLTHGMVRLIGHVRTGRENTSLTLSTLRFGCKMAKYLFSQVIYNARPELANVAEVLQDEVARLENEEHQNSLIRAGGEYNANNVFQSEIKHIERLISQFLGNTRSQITESTLLSIAHPLLREESALKVDNRDLKTKHELREARVQRGFSVFDPDKASDGFSYSFRKSSNDIPANDKPEAKIQTPPVSQPSRPSDEKPASDATSEKKASVGSGKRKSVARKSLKRQSIKKSKGQGQGGGGGGGKTGGGKAKAPGKPEPPEVPPDFNKEMFEFGMKNEKWFFGEFLKRNTEVDQQFKAVNELLTNARNEKDKVSWSLVELRKNLAEASYDLEEAAYKQSAGIGDPAVEQELLPKIEAIKLKINETIEAMKTNHNAYLNAIAARDLYMKETAEPKFKEFVDDLKIKMTEIPQKKADEKDLPLSKTDTFWSLRPGNRIEERTSSEIEFVGLQKKHGVKKTGNVVKKV